MNRVSPLLFSLLLLTGPALAGPSQEQSAPAPMTHASHGAMAMPNDPAHQGAAAAQTGKAFKALDKNQDGALSKAELGKHPKAMHFGMADMDGNGSLDLHEFGMLQAM